CDVWLMLMRNTSAPAMNSCSMTERSDEAGPSVATILVRRWRLIALDRQAGAARQPEDRPAGGGRSPPGAKAGRDASALPAPRRSDRGAARSTTAARRC